MPWVEQKEDNRGVLSAGSIVVQKSAFKFYMISITGMRWMNKQEQTNQHMCHVTPGTATAPDPIGAERTVTVFTRQPLAASIMETSGKIKVD